MTQDEKKLLLRDLCARLPYGVKGIVSRSDHNNRKCEFVATIDGKLYDRFAVFQESWYDNITIKPYLFPLSSMTKEQNLEYLRTCLGGNAGVPTLASFEWCDKNHFDYRGLIPMGIAMDATGKNIY